MAKFYTPSKDPDSWKEFLAEPDKQWAAPVHPALAALVRPCTSNQDIPQDLWLIVGKMRRGFRNQLLMFFNLRRMNCFIR